MYAAVIPPFINATAVSNIIANHENDVLGNIDDGQDIVFQWQSEGTDSNGDEFDLNEYLEVNVTSSPKMGADKENPEFTKLMAPLASKSYVLATPDNYEYFLSRYGMFSYVDA